MNYKKKRPTSQRSHCKMCKRWKINGFDLPLRKPEGDTVLGLIGGGKPLPLEIRQIIKKLRR